MKREALFVLAVLAVSACIQQEQAGPVCSKPYISVGGECCLDENGDGICDRDKPICNAPYLLVGGKCCIDTNGNGVCDTDEPSTTTVTATTSTQGKVFTTTTSSIAYTTSTVELPEAKCATVYDCPTYGLMKCDDDHRAVNDTYGPISCTGGICKYRASRNTGAVECNDWETCVIGAGCVSKYDTTTTLAVSGPATSSTIKYSEFQKIMDRVSTRYQETQAALASSTTTTQPPCYDSDGGIKYETRSINVSGYYEYNNTMVGGLNESCQDNKKLVEFYCESNVLRTRITECDSWCSAGRCCGGESHICSGDNDCCSGACRAVGISHLCVLL